jgi:hypothetical protein
VKEESTLEHILIEDDTVICVSRDMGNVRQWANIELVTFYGNIVIMICYLIKFSILNHERPNSIENSRLDQEQKEQED